MLGPSPVRFVPNVAGVINKVLSFRVSDLGRIKEAGYSAAPLTLLVGRNNTGKSYFATIIWLLCRLELILSSESRPANRPEWFNSLLESAATGGSKVTITAAEAAENVAVVQSIFDTSSSALLARIFAYDGFDSTRLKLSVAENFQPVTISITPSENSAEVEDARPRRGVVTVAFETEGRQIRRTRYTARNCLMTSFAADRVFVDGIGLSLFGPDWFHYKNTSYIPAARTGLMMALRPLIARTFDVDEQQPASQIPAAIADFISKVVDPDEGFGSPVAEWLEKTVLRGSVKLSSTDDVPEYDYTPINTNVTVPLRATSSMITELAPFVHLVRSSYSRHFIFEEPEAHLHLSAQRDIARGIARLLNEGIHFTVTTHSDTFIQQINNLMNLHTHQNRDNRLAELNYEVSDLIDPQKCAAYEFSGDDGITRVSKLSRTEYGFAVPTLNETIISLAEETMALQETDDED